MDTALQSTWRGVAGAPRWRRRAAVLVLRAAAVGQGWAAREQGRWALWLPVVAMIGDAGALAQRHDPPAWLGGALLAAGLGALLVRRWVSLHVAGSMLAALGFGIAAVQLATARAPGFVALPSRAAMIAGQVMSIDALPNGARAALDHVTIDGVALGPRHIQLRLADAAGLAPGAAITVRAMIEPPAAPAYPGGRDLQRDAYFAHLAGNGYALGPAVIARPAAPDHLAGLRARIAAHVRAALPGAPGALAATLLTGLSAAIPPDDRAAFRDAGLAHLLAIAGLHIGIVMGLAVAVTRWALLRSERAALFWPVRQIAGGVAWAAGLAYLLLTGLHVPTLRAFVMASVVLACLLGGRRAAAQRSWGIAALLVIALQPAQITGPSFQLSFAAVLALIAGYQALREPLSRLRADGAAWRRGLHHVATLALTSALAGLASMPFVAYHFGSIQLYFIVANLVAVPITALWVMPAGLLALLLMPLGLDRLALWPMDWGLRAILWVAHSVASWPGARLGVPHLPLPGLVCMALGLAWLCLWRSPLRAFGLAGLLAGVLAAALAHPPDLLIAPDARLVGLRAEHAVYVHAVRGGDAYVQSSWSQWLDRPAQDMAAASPGRAACSPAGCLLHAGRPARAVQLDEPDGPCGSAVLWVVQSGNPPFCPGAQAIGRSAIWRAGAISVWLGATTRILTDRDVRGDRPWVFLPPEQRRAELGLPLAPRDQ